MVDFSKLAKAAEELLAILRQNPQYFDGEAIKAPLPAAPFNTGRGVANKHPTASVGFQEGDFLPDDVIEGGPDDLPVGHAVYGDTSKKVIDKRPLTDTGKDISAQGLPGDR